MLCLTKAISSLCSIAGDTWCLLWFMYHRHFTLKYKGTSTKYMRAITPSLPTACPAQAASRTLQCSPLHTYSHASHTWPSGGGKVFVRPAGGVRAWHVHHGWVDPSHSRQKAAKRWVGWVLRAVAGLLGLRKVGELVCCC